MLTENYKAVNIEYALWLGTLGFSNGVINDYRDRARDFFEWLQANNITHLTALQQQHISTYFDYLQTRPNKRRKGALSASHLNHNFAAVDKLLEFLHQMGSSSAPIPTAYRIKPDKQARISKIQPLTREEIKALQDNITNPQLYTNAYYSFAKREQKEQTLKLIFALYYGCGLRRMEGYRLTVNDIDFERKTVFIRQGKGYKDRIVPMSKGVYEVLQDYVYNFRNLQRAKHKRLFLHTTGTLNNILQDLHRITESESLQSKRVTLHILRHSIATHLLQAGMNIESIALFLGHSSLESTQVYTHVAAAQ